MDLEDWRPRCGLQNNQGWSESVRPSQAKHRSQTDQSKQKERGAGLSIPWSGRRKVRKLGFVGGPLNGWSLYVGSKQGRWFCKALIQDVFRMHACIATCRRYFAEFSEWAHLGCFRWRWLWRANTEHCRQPKVTTGSIQDVWKMGQNSKASLKKGGVS